MLHNKYFKIIKEFLKGYKKEIYGRELINKVNLSQKNIALTLNKLEKQGILVSKASGNRRYYSLNSSNPLLKEYIILFENFRKIEFLESNKRMIDFSKGIKGEIVCIFGSYAKERAGKGSDLDILVIGNIDSLQIRKIGNKYDYNVQVFNLSLTDFKRGIKKNSSLILEVVENHVIIKGIEKFVREIYG